jgi:CelD/BcsL family acetyltransferase involved in cellulose biosynthesis
MAFAWAFEPAIPAVLSADIREQAVATWPRDASTRESVQAVTLDVITERKAFDALEAEWNDLFERAGRDTQLFQSFNWSWHWANHYLPAGGRRSLAVVTARRHGRLVLVWPLVAERVAGLKVLHWMGEPVSQYGDVIVEAGPHAAAILRQAWEFIAARLGADAVILRKVRADSAVAPLLCEFGLRRTLVAKAPYLDLTGAPDFAAYEQRYSAKSRKNRRRLMRRLEERGPVQVVRYASGRHARRVVLEAIALKRAQLAAAGRPAPAMTDERFAAFFADVAEGCERPAGCGMTVLTSGGETAGVGVDVSFRGRRAAHILVHDTRLDGCGAGVLLTQEWIRGASADGIATFDFLAPAHGYKMDWADGATVVEDFACGLTLAGRAYVAVYLHFVRERLKAAAEALAGRLARLRRLRSASTK